jgi:type II restriction enzyme
MPDIIAHSSQKNWLFLIEAVDSSGAISPTRFRELRRWARHCLADIVFVTAFPNRETFCKFDIAWETEVWIADAPEHMIHFDGEKFLGPYKSQ